MGGWRRDCRRLRPVGSPAARLRAGPVPPRAPRRRALGHVSAVREQYGRRFRAQSPTIVEPVGGPATARRSASPARHREANESHAVALPQRSALQLDETPGECQLSPDAPLRPSRRDRLGAVGHANDDAATLRLRGRRDRRLRSGAGDRVVEHERECLLHSHEIPRDAGKRGGHRQRDAHSPPLGARLRGGDERRQEVGQPQRLATPLDGAAVDVGDRAQTSQLLVRRTARILAAPSAAGVAEAETFRVTQ